MTTDNAARLTSVRTQHARRQTDAATPAARREEDLRRYRSARERLEARRHDRGDRFAYLKRAHD